ncbi:hypothetical protein Tsubulata_047187, partial [Turnera subulata]
MINNACHGKVKEEKKHPVTHITHTSLLSQSHNPSLHLGTNLLLACPSRRKSNYLIFSRHSLVSSVSRRRRSAKNRRIMARRGRPRKLDPERLQAALHSMRSYGFAEDLVTKTIRELLAEYGGQDGWVFIEDDSYKVLVEAILEKVAPEEGHRSEGNVGKKSVAQTSRASTCGNAEGLTPSHASNLSSSASQTGNVLKTEREVFSAIHHNDDALTPSSKANKLSNSTSQTENPNNISVAQTSNVFPSSAHHNPEASTPSSHATNLSKSTSAAGNVNKISVAQTSN